MDEKKCSCHSAPKRPEDIAIRQVGNGFQIVPYEYRNSGCAADEIFVFADLAGVCAHLKKYFGGK